VTRIGEFLRSVIPADPWQLLYLVGAVFLFMSPRLTWLFGTGIAYSFMVIGLIPVVIAGVLAYYGCFRASAQPIRRMAFTVFLPALLGLCLIIGEYAFSNKENRSVFTHRSGLAAFLEECVTAFKEHPAGLSLAVIALAMLGVFAIRLHLGISSLPLRLGGSACSEDESVAPWSRMQMLIFVLVCPLFLLSRFSWTLFSIPSWSWYRSGTSGFSVYIVLAEAIHASLLVLVAILILGESGGKSARSSLQLPKPRFVFFGLVLPIFVSFTISLLQYGHDRAQWAANDFGRVSPPRFTSYFSLGPSWRWTLALMVFAALAEEIVFRGMLLASLLRRYGLYRGIFLAGLIWAAFHFHSDMRLRYSMAQALLQLASRIAICLAMNYVLSWMTLHWNSVIPASTAHTVSNVLVVGGINSGIEYAHAMRIILWSVCALVLFHYWPPPEEAGTRSGIPAGFPTPHEASHVE
jgi:membrane protease YdiL (CAAX protease family)